MAQIITTVNVDLSKLKRDLLLELIKNINPKLNSIIKLIDPQVRTIVGEALKQEEHYRSILSGRLRQEFGLENPDNALDSIIDAVKKSVKLEKITGKGDFLGGVFIGAYLEDFSDALSASGASYFSVNKTGKQTLIEWLKWLLFEGDAIIITNYGISERPAKGSRTGAHIMLRVARDGAKVIQPWRVPPQFSGTEGSNWIIKAVQNAAPKIEQLLEKTAKLVLNGQI